MAFNCFCAEVIALVLERTQSRACAHDGYVRHLCVRTHVRFRIESPYRRAPTGDVGDKVRVTCEKGNKQQHTNNAAYSHRSRA